MLIKMMKMVLMPAPEGVESTGGDFSSVSPLRSPPAAACWLSVSVFFIYAVVVSMKPLALYI
jgi:hypothetical protein